MAAPETDKENDHAAQQPHLQAHPRERREHLRTEAAAHSLRAAASRAAQAWGRPTCPPTGRRTHSARSDDRRDAIQRQGREPTGAAARGLASRGGRSRARRATQSTRFPLRAKPRAVRTRHQPSPRPSLRALLLSAQLGREAPEMRKWFQPWGGPQP